MKYAFKDWAVIVDALGRGEQILILRKGGIREGKVGFELKHHQFLLFSTQFHQQRESVTPEAQTRFDQLPNSPDSNIVTIEFIAEVAASYQLENHETVSALKDQHIWREEVIRDRFDWGTSKGIFAIAVRIRKLEAPVVLKMLPEYGGCKSWIELEQEIDISNARPVLSEEQFQSKLQKFNEVIHSNAS